VVGAAAQPGRTPREAFDLAQVSSPRASFGADAEAERSALQRAGEAAVKVAVLQVVLEGLRSISFWGILLVTAVVAYIAAYLIAHSGYRPQTPQRAPHLARAAIGWGMLLSVLLPLAVAWRLEWPLIWAVILVAPFLLAGGLALLTNSR
jgi:hypothetical protein